MSNIEIVEANGTRILFDASKCIHSRNCVLSRPDVFVPNVQGAWIHPERATPEEVAELAHSCPSGAIRYQRLDGRPGEGAPRVNTIHVRENGPLAVHADLRLSGQEPIHRATLCRCGASHKKPFCDGSHTAMGFQATGEPKTKPTSELQLRGGELKLVPMTDSPLAIEGPVEIVSGTGRTINRTAKAALCRCGQSQNKPYCDGSHVAANFKSG